MDKILSDDAQAVSEPCACWPGRMCDRVQQCAALTQQPAAQQWEPLTEGQIRRIELSVRQYKREPLDITRFARAIECAHGIGGKKQPAAQAVSDPTDPGHDVEVLREHVRHLERHVRQLSAAQAIPVAWVEAVKVAFGEIAWSNDSKWQADRARAALAQLDALGGGE